MGWAGLDGARLGKARLCVTINRPIFFCDDRVGRATICDDGVGRATISQAK